MRYVFEVQTGSRAEILEPPSEETWAQWLADGVVEPSERRRTEPRPVTVYWADAYVAGSFVAGHYRIEVDPVSLDVYEELGGAYEAIVVSRAVEQWMKACS